MSFYFLKNPCYRMTQTKVHILHIVDTYHYSLRQHKILFYSWLQVWLKSAVSQNFDWKGSYVPQGYYMTFAFCLSCFSFLKSSLWNLTNRSYNLEKMTWVKKTKICYNFLNCYSEIYSCNLNYYSCRYNLIFFDKIFLCYSQCFHSWNFFYYCLIYSWKLQTC